MPWEVFISSCAKLTEPPAASTSLITRKLASGSWLNTKVPPLPCTSAGGGSRVVTTFRWESSSGVMGSETGSTRTPICMGSVQPVTS